MRQTSTRAGELRWQPTGYQAFLPAPLPPNPPLTLDPKLLELHSTAMLEIGRLDGCCDQLPDPSLFVLMHVRKEAVISSQIEGTQASLANFLDAEAQVLDPDSPKDVEEVINYVAALNQGIELLNELPVSLRLIREIHAVLMKDSRGGEKSPGEFRRSQNWIGPASCTLTNARFVPPPPDELIPCLGQWERFWHEDHSLPPLLKIGLAHAQFETLHPFLDGNGRLGRLLIALMLMEQKLLRLPLLYLSTYFKLHRLEYYDRLQAVRESGDWEGWMKFYLQGVAEVATQAFQTIKDVSNLRISQRANIQASTLRNKTLALELLEALYLHPVVTIHKVCELSGKTFPTSSNLVQEFMRLGILVETSGKSRSRVFRHEPYFRLFE